MDVFNEKSTSFLFFSPPTHPPIHHLVRLANLEEARNELRRRRRRRSIDRTSCRLSASPSIGQADSLSIRPLVGRPYYPSAHSPVRRIGHPPLLDSSSAPPTVALLIKNRSCRTERKTGDRKEESPSRAALPLSSLLLSTFTSVSNTLLLLAGPISPLSFTYPPTTIA